MQWSSFGMYVLFVAFAAVLVNAGDVEDNAKQYDFIELRGDRDLRGPNVCTEWEEISREKKEHFTVMEQTPVERW